MVSNLSKLFVLILALVAPVVGQTAAKPGSVSGRVTVAGKPAANVKVMLLPAGWNGDTSNGSKTTTDADGKYRAESASAGQLVVVAFAPGYTGPSDNRYGQPGKVVSLGPGENAENVDLELTLGGVVTGRVVDERGRPVVGETVTFYVLDAEGKRQPTQDGFWQEPRTDDRGIYRAYGLAPGRYIATVGRGARSMMFGRRSYPLTYAPGTAEQSAARIISVEAGGEARDVDIVIARKAKGYALTGRVIGEDGKSIAGLSVEYVVKVGENFGLTGRPTRGDASGAFRFDGLAPGRYVVFSRPEIEAAVGMYGESDEVTVTDRDVTGIEVHMQRGATVTGTATLERAPASAELGQFTIYLIGEAPSEVRVFTGGGVARIKPDGTFRVVGVPPGRCTIGIGFSQRGKKAQLVRVERDGVAMDGPLDVPAGEDVANIHLVIGFGSGLVQGDVHFTGGPPPDPQHVGVRVSRVGVPGIAAWADLDARGQFVVDGLSPGEYEISVVDTSKSWRDPVVLATKTVTASNDAPARVTLTIEIGGTGGAR